MYLQRTIVAVGLVLVLLHAYGVAVMVQIGDLFMLRHHSYYMSLQAHMDHGNASDTYFLLISFTLGVGVVIALLVHGGLLLTPIMTRRTLAVRILWLLPLGIGVLGCFMNGLLGMEALRGAPLMIDASLSTSADPATTPSPSPSTVPGMGALMTRWEAIVVLLVDAAGLVAYVAAFLTLTGILATTTSSARSD